jgi:hypothetical protein
MHSKSKKEEEQNDAKHAHLLLEWILRVVLDPETNVSVNLTK